MSDIDFDELDKAVNNLMSKDGSPLGQVAPTSESNVAVNVSQVSSTPEEVSGADEAVTPPAPVAQISDNSPVASPAVRRRGQFMDIVGPQASKKLTMPVSRQGVNIPAPRTTDVVAPNLTEKTEEPAVQPTEEMSVDVPVQNFSTPEASFTGEQEATTLGSTDDSVNDSDHDVSTSAEPSSQPLVSPFLPDAKPDKRPLGAPSSLTLENLGSELEKENAESSDVPNASGTAPLEPLPAELHPEINSLDSETTTKSEATPEITDPTDTKEGLTDTSTTPTIQPQVAASAMSAPVSIPQQYEEKKSSVEETNGSIYDTSEYHQPLQHPEKKKSSLPTIVLILACILLGAAAAAVYYYLTVLR